MSKTRNKKYSKSKIAIKHSDNLIRNMYLIYLPLENGNKGIIGYNPIKKEYIVLNKADVNLIKKKQFNYSILTCVLCKTQIEEYMKSIEIHANNIDLITAFKITDKYQEELVNSVMPEHIQCIPVIFQPKKNVDFDTKEAFDLIKDFLSGVTSNYKYKEKIKC